MKEYTTKSGRKLFKPSLEELQKMDGEQQGFCLACGNTQDGCEPDARKYECDGCGEEMVYGAAELALRGLCY